MEAKIAGQHAVHSQRWISCQRRWHAATRAFVILLLTILSCSDISVTAVDISDIAIEPATLNLAVGQTGRFTVTLRDESGNVLSGRPVAWSSSNSTVVTVGSDGSVIALASGDATIRASSEGEQAEATVRVAPPPVIAVQPAAATFRATAGGTAPSPIQIAIRNDGTGSLENLSTAIAYNSGEPGGWLSASLESRSAPTMLTLAATPGSLAPGTYTAAVTVSSPASVPASQTITVTLEVSEPAPGIALAATTASFTAVQDGTNPASQTIAVTNSGGGTLNGLTVTTNYGGGQPTGWLTASLSAATAPATLTLDATTASLPVGTHTATVSIASSAAINSPRTVSVTFTVSAVPPTLILAPTTLILSGTAGGVNPAPQVVSVSNGGTGSVDGLSVDVNYPAGTATGWLLATLNGSSAPATLFVAADIGALPVGNYTATVVVSSTSAANSPQSINVSLTVNPAVAAPDIALSPTSVAFNATAGGANPATQTVDITNGGTGTLAGLATSITYGSGQPTGWLNANLSGTSAPATITLSATTGSLAAGTYSATVNVTSGVASNSPQTVNVTFTVAAAPVPPAIALSQSNFTFNATAGGANPSNQTLNVTNTGGGTLTGLATSVSYGAGQPTGWLNANLSGTSAPATITLSATTGSLAAGTYSATVNVTSGVASNSPQTVNVTFTVAAAPVPPAIGLSPTSVSFNATAGGGDPAAATVAVTNTGGQTLTGLAVSLSYGSGQPGAWLSASLDQTTAPATITLQAMTGSLAAGTYDATVSVSSSAASNSPQTVAVTFTVAPAPVPPAIGLSATNVSFSGTAGGSDPSNQTVNVANSGGGTLSGLSTTITYGSGQPTGWLNASLSGTTAPATVTFSATTGSLAAGTYTATVSVSSAVASNSPQMVDVTFTVAPPPSIDLSSTSVSFNATAGSGNPSAQSVSITNGGGGTLSGLATAINYTSGPSGWLSASLSGTTAPATLSLQATTGTLAAGTYSADVSVSSPGASNSPRTVTVVFTVDPVQAPAAPTNLNANGQGNMIRLTWDDNSNNEASFEIQRNTTGANGPWTTIASLPANSTDYRDRNYVGGVTYWYRVLACNAGGCTSSNVDTGSN